LLSSASTSTVTVHWAAADGTAVAPGDYQAGSGTLTFNPGQTSQPVTIQVVGDTIDEQNETLTVSLSNPTNAIIARGTGLGTIADDDPTPISKTLSPAAIAVLDDYTGSGIFTAQSDGTNGFSVRKFNFTVPTGTPYDERSVLEFATGS